MARGIKVTVDGRMTLPADLRLRCSLEAGGLIVAEEVEDGIALRTIGQAVARAQAISRKLVTGKVGVTVEDFLAERG